jgi:hypothetical protein
MSTHTLVCQQHSQHFRVLAQCCKTNGIIVVGRRVDTNICEQHSHYFRATRESGGTKRHVSKSTGVDADICEQLSRPLRVPCATTSHELVLHVFLFFGHFLKSNKTSF